MSARYHGDFYAWTHSQAQLLREQQWQAVDIEHLIEEIESMGKREKRALKSRLTVLLMHMLKWQYQPAFRSTSWQLTLRHQRRAILEMLEDSPSLKADLQTTLTDAYEQAKDDASLETGIDVQRFTPLCAWTLEQVLNLQFLPD